MRPAEIVGWLLALNPSQGPVARSISGLDARDVPAIRNVLDPVLAIAIGRAAAEQFAQDQRDVLDEVYTAVANAWRADQDGAELLLKALQTERIAPHVRAGGRVVRGYIRRVDRNQPALPAGVPRHVVPAGTALHHGTPEQFDGQQLRGGGYDGVAWFADKEIAALYLPKGARHSLSVHDLSRPSESALITEVQRRLGLEFDDIKRDDSGRLRSWRKVRDLPEDAYKTSTDEETGRVYRWDDVRPEWAVPRLREMGLINEEDATGFLDTFRTMHVYADGEQLLKVGERPDGRMITATASEPLMIADLAAARGYESDLTNLEYHQLDRFKKLREAGFDGVRINDFAQSEEWGNLQHLSIGLFPRGLRKVALQEEPAKYTEWERRLSKAVQEHLWGVVRPDARAAPPPPSFERASGHQLDLFRPAGLGDDVEVRGHARVTDHGVEIVSPHRRHVEHGAADELIPAPFLRDPATVALLRKEIPPYLENSPLNRGMLQEILADAAEKIGHWPPVNIPELAAAIGVAPNQRATNPATINSLTCALAMGADPTLCIQLMNRLNAAGWYQAPALSLTEPEVDRLLAAAPWSWGEDPAPRGHELRRRLAVWAQERASKGEPLAKGQQLGLFVPRAPGQVEEIQVRGHLRHTPAGVTVVAPHQRTQEAAPAVPPDPHAQLVAEVGAWRAERITRLRAINEEVSALHRRQGEVLASYRSDESEEAGAARRAEDRALGQRRGVLKREAGRVQKELDAGPPRQPEPPPAPAEPPAPRWGPAGPPPEDKSLISFDPSLFRQVGEHHYLKIGGLGVPTTGYNPNRRDWGMEEREAAEAYARKVGGYVEEHTRPVMERIAWSLPREKTREGLRDALDRLAAANYDGSNVHTAIRVALRGSPSVAEILELTAAADEVIAQGKATTEALAVPATAGEALLARLRAIDVSDAPRLPDYDVPGVKGIGMLSTGIRAKTGRNVDNLRALKLTSKEVDAVVDLASQAMSAKNGLPADQMREEIEDISRLYYRATVDVKRLDSAMIRVTGEFTEQDRRGEHPYWMEQPGADMAERVLRAAVPRVTGRTA